jgi:two-component system, NtrC family, nitrogen regulation sensor histidine kinase NtrY
MTSAEAAPAPFDSSLAEPKGSSLQRLLAPFAVGIALLSAFLTFIVLTGLTQIEPTPPVVRSFYLLNVATILLLVGIIVREVWQVDRAAASRAGRDHCQCDH